MTITTADTREGTATSKSLTRLARGGSSFLLAAGIVVFAVLMAGKEVGAQEGTDFHCGGADLNGDGVIGVPDFSAFGACYNDPALSDPAEGVLGLSSETTQAVLGVLALNGRCVETYGAGARMCASVELLHLSPPVSVPPGSYGWIRAVFDDGKDVATGIEASGTAGVSCSIGSRHLVYRFETSAGEARLVGEGCSQQHPVLCCR